MGYKDIHTWGERGRGGKSPGSGSSPVTDLLCGLGSLTAPLWASVSLFHEMGDLSLASLPLLYPWKYVLLPTPPPTIPHTLGDRMGLLHDSHPQILVSSLRLKRRFQRNESPLQLRSPKVYNGEKKGKRVREEPKGQVVWEERAQGEAKRWSSQSQQRPSSGARADRGKSSLKIPLKVNRRDPGGLVAHSTPSTLPVFPQGEPGKAGERGVPGPPGAVVSISFGSLSLSCPCPIPISCRRDTEPPAHPSGIRTPSSRPLTRAAFLSCPPTSPP